MFIPLRIKTDGSYLNSVLDIQDIINFIIKRNIPILSICDDATFAFISQQHILAKQYGYIAVSGIEITLKYKAILYNLMLIPHSSEAFASLNAYILEQYKQNTFKTLICTLPTFSFPQNITAILLDVSTLDIHFCYIKDLVEQLCKHFSYVYIGIEKYEEGAINNKIEIEAIKVGIPTVITNVFNMISTKEYKYLDMLFCIQNNYRFHSNSRKKCPQKSALEDIDIIAARFAHNPSAIINTFCIAERSSNFLLGIKKTATIPTINGISLQEAKFLFIKKLIQAARALLTPHIPSEELDAYCHRLLVEMRVVLTLNFHTYFLLLEDLISWCRANSILVGPGRGSAAGSLITYLLQITSIDPIRWGLIFERFLNYARAEMPDIDVDFPKDKRDVIISYLENRWGQNQVTQILTHGTLSARAILKDIGRALGISIFTLDDITAKIDAVFGKSPSIKELITREYFLYMQDNNPAIRELFDFANRLEKKKRQAGMHAAGILIDKQPITTHVGVNIIDGSYVAQITKDEASYLGLLKLDILGLRTLSIVHDILIAVRKKGLVLSLSDIDIADNTVFEYLANNSTYGVFQLESLNMTKLIHNMQPRNITDLAIAIALYRPGPMDNIPIFLKNRSEGYTSGHWGSDIDDILIPTSGVIVFQEQVIKISQLAAGFSNIEADAFRKNIGAKRSLGSLKETFIERTISFSRYTPKKAQELWNLLEHFASYGFNKAHAISYAHITFYTAYLKVYHILEFYTATFNHEMQDKSKLIEFIMDGLNNGVILLNPSVNYSNEIFTIESGKVRWGLASIKNLSSVDIQHILGERRENGLYPDLASFLSRTHLSDKTITLLVDVGAFDEFGHSRGYLRSNITIIQQEIKASLFLSIYKATYKIPSCEDMFQITKDDRLIEYKVLGIPISWDVKRIKSMETKGSGLTPVSLHDLRYNMSSRPRGLYKCQFSYLACKKYKRGNNSTFKDNAIVITIYDGTRIEDILVYNQNIIRTLYNAPFVEPLIKGIFEYSPFKKHYISLISII